MESDRILEPTVQACCTGKKKSQCAKFQARALEGDTHRQHPVSKDDVKAISECLIKAALAFKPTKKGEWSKRDIAPVVREYLQVDNMRLHAPNACPYRIRRWKP